MRLSVKKLPLVGRGIAATAAMILACSAQASWDLNGSESSVNFISVKKSAVAEVHRFNEVWGSIDESGNVKISIALDSVDTLIPIRDERMRKMLFETGLFPNAEVIGRVDVESVKDLAPGESQVRDVEFTLSLHGHQQAIKTQVQVVALSGGRLQVSTLKPLAINASDFDLIKGVNKLREVAKLPSISTAVPVFVRLVFKQ